MATEVRSHDYSFSIRLEEYMRTEKLYPTSLSRKAGISRSMIYKYLDGSCFPDGLTLKKLAVKLKVSADWLLGLSDIR